jgi:hypothetical protein
VETIIEPCIDIVKKGVLIGSTTKLGNKLGGILVGRNLNRSSALATTTTRVVGIPQMVFTNLVTATHGNKTTYQPLMSSMVIKGCRSVNVMHSKGEYQEPITIMELILDHKDGHYHY